MLWDDFGSQHGTLGGAKSIENEILGALGNQSMVLGGPYEALGTGNWQGSDVEVARSSVEVAMVPQNNSIYY